MLDSLGIYSGREPGGSTAESVVSTQPDPNAPPSVTPQPAPPPPQPTPTPTPAPLPTPAPMPPLAAEPPKTDLISDLSKAFAKDIGEVPTPSQAEPPKPDETRPVAEPPKEKTWRDIEPPQALTKNARESWQTFRTKAFADIDARDAKIKALETELTEVKKTAPNLQTELEQVKGQLTAAQQIVERVALERSPVFKSKVIDQEELIRSRLAKVIPGTGITEQEAANLLRGDLTTREGILENRPMTAMRRTQIVDLLGKWDVVAEERDRMLARGKESLTEFLKEQQAAEESRRAQYMRESEKVFDDQEALCTPKLEPYVRIDGNEDWNRNTLALRQAARRIYSGSVDRQTLAQVALLAPAAIVYQKLLQGSMARIQELEAQVNKMRGVVPTVRDRGADAPTPGSPASGGLSSPNGDFVKSLVSRFQKETGL
jgi:archaellum component FlaC